VKEVDPYDLKAAIAAVKEAVATKEPAVLVMRRECVQLQKKKKQFQVDPDLCTGCETCLELGCPALVKRAETMEIADTCSGCGVCAQICPAEAITER
jgi:indolepyruvate ferredoxin oxidoreductase alpha subunit